MNRQLPRLSGCKDPVLVQGQLMNGVVRVSDRHRLDMDGILLKVDCCPGVSAGSTPVSIGQHTTLSRILSTDLGEPQDPAVSHALLLMVKVVVVIMLLLLVVLP